MVTPATVRTLALSFPETGEQPHFERKAFRVRGKIFATLDEKLNRVMVRLTPEDQSVFCAIDKSMIYPVPGGWGRGGATYIELRRVRKPLFRDALTTAYCTVAPAKLAEKYLPK